MPEPLMRRRLRLLPLVETGSLGTAGLEVGVLPMMASLHGFASTNVLAGSAHLHRHFDHQGRLLHRRVVYHPDEAVHQELHLLDSLQIWAPQAPEYTKFQFGLRVNSQSRL